MNITNQFFLTYYIGDKALNLMSIPEELNNDLKLRSEYNKFIDGISTIYASQTSTDSIPVFWTMLSGNNYIPNPESTLKFLEPKQSYYFITKDDTVIPLTIPIVGKVLPGFTDNSILPLIEATGDTNLVNKGENYAYLSFRISGLQPYEDYRYKFNGVSANWPTLVSPISGILKPPDDNLDLDCVITFCNTESGCNAANNILSYTIDNHGINLSNLYSIINLEINPISYSGESVISDNYGIRCQDCLPRLTINIPELAILTSAQSSNSNIAPVQGDNRFYTFESIISGLEPNHLYAYSYRSLDANWPAVVMTPISGTIKSATNTFKLKTTIAFCLNSGVCPSGTKGLLNYTYAPILNRNNLFTSIDMSVHKTEDDSDPVISNPLTIYCQDCL